MDIVFVTDVATTFIAEGSGGASRTLSTRNKYGESSQTTSSLTGGNGRKPVLHLAMTVLFAVLLDTASAALADSGEDRDMEKSAEIAINF